MAEPLGPHRTGAMASNALRNLPLICIFGLVRSISRKYFGIEQIAQRLDNFDLNLFEHGNGPFPFVVLGYFLY